MKKNFSLILHDIRSTHNVGSLFRTAECVGISKIYLTGYTPTPQDRFGRARKDIAKVALGAEKTLPWEQYKNIEDLIEKLKKDGNKIIAIEQSPHAVDYKKIEIEKEKPHTFILGNEVEGISQEILSLADDTVEIPLMGEKESLNVSVAGGVALFGMLDRD